MKRKRTLLALLSSAPLYVLGCGEDVGDCQDANEGRNAVRVGTRIEFGGQAIINQACATCHGSKVKGDARRGAPAGLDFDLYPVESGEADENKDGQAYVKLKSSDVAGLRERQRKVFEERNSIWQQIKDGLMPPDGVGLTYRTITKMIFRTTEADLCTGGKAYAALTQKSTQDVLRNWLACGAPIVESSNSTVTETKGVSGQAGYQYPSCGINVGGDGGAGDGGGTAITIEMVQTAIFDTCAGCHIEGGVYEDLDLSSAEKSYAALVEDTAAKCNGKPFVKTMDPDGSYLFDKISKDDPGCNSDRMPPGGELSSSEQNIIRQWIQGGALRESDVKSKSLGPIGVDAGLP